MSALEPYHRGLRPDRMTSQRLAQIHRMEAVLQAEDRANTRRAAGRISDLTKVTRHGIGAAALIAVEAEMAAQMSPWAANQIAAVASSGITGIRGVIIDLANGS